MKAARLTLAMAALALSHASCMHVARSRAEDDRAVGHAHGAGLRVDVDDGLACVRELGAGRIVMRAQAPELTARIVAEAPAERLEIAFKNLLPDASIEVVTASGLVATPLDSAAQAGKERAVVLEGVPAGEAIVASVRARDGASRGRFRFAILADVQEALPRVGDIYERMAADKSIRFVVFSGDLTRRGSAEELSAFEAAEARLPVPLFATLGNHELGSDRVYFQEMFGRASTSFVFRGVRFSLVDSASASVDPEVYDLLDGWLARGRRGPHVVAMHIPPLDPAGSRNGGFASRVEAGKLLARLAGGEVDFTVYGHVHTYYAFENAGIPAVISGGGGSIPDRLDGIGRHYVAVDVDSDSGIEGTQIVEVDGPGR